jgi:ATP-dependent Lon protease
VSQLLAVPEANHGDVDELPEYVKEGVNFHFASHFRDVAKILFPPGRDHTLILYVF